MNDRFVKCSCHSLGDEVCDQFLQAIDVPPEGLWLQLPRWVSVAIDQICQEFAVKIKAGPRMKKKSRFYELMIRKFVCVFLLLSLPVCFTPSQVYAFDKSALPVGKMQRVGPSPLLG